MGSCRYIGGNVAKKFIGYQEEEKWWERFTIALTRKKKTKTEVLRGLVRKWTEETEAEEQGREADE